ncbi:MAG: 2-oxo acid dehydrogenase subunit E2, partial [Alphaproteobacteria bacterium]|nr:2-oxo acid dehydrogenase subunit E2 [Alphaproteobacteria bacterium]
MSTQIVVPPMGESVSEATVAKWLKKVGDAVKMDEPLVELETDKVTLEVNATTTGVISEIKATEGATVGVGAVLGMIQAGSAAVSAPTASASTSATKPAPVAANAPAPAAQPAVMPAARKQAEDRGINPYAIPGSGKDGRVMKEDVLNYAGKPATTPAAPARAAQPSGPRSNADREERVKMTRLRQRIAERLKEAQNTAAMLTTFNEVDMGNIMALRAQHKDAFEKKNGVKLGFMSFFVKACIQALKELPAVNAEIDGEDLVYKNYYD